MRILIVSNLDSGHPFGQFLRPFHLGAGLVQAGAEVTMVGVDCQAVDYAPSWSTSRRSLRSLARAAAFAAARCRPDVVYGHEMRGAVASILGVRGVPLVADFHSITSVEWAGFAADAPPPQAALYRVAGLRAAAAERLVTRRARRIIAAGDEVAEDLRRVYGLKAMPTVVGNGVTREFLARATGGSSPYESGRHALATIPGGQSVSNARALTFLAAVAEELHGAADPVALHVLGSDDGPGAPGIRYEGYQADLLAWVGSADVCLLPYPDDAALSGGARNKLLEYLARGRTLVTTREGLRGVREAATWSGVTVTDDDSQAFAAAIRAAADPAAPTLAPVREQVHERLRWDRLARETLGVLTAAADPSP